MTDRMGTILVVEDDPLVRGFVVEELQDAGYRVLEAETGETATALAAGHPFDVLFTDIRLSGQVDGFGLAKTIRAVKPDIGVIYCTGYTSQRDQQLPGTVFLMKPYRPSELLAAIKTLLLARDQRG